MAELFHANSYVVWMLSGSLFLFGPLIVLTLILLKRDGYVLNFHTIKERLRLKRISRKDFLWLIGGMGICTVLSGVVLFLYSLVTGYFDLSSLQDMSPIKYVPLTGTARYFLLYLPVFYFLNYCGEEVMWRGTAASHG